MKVFINPGHMPGIDPGAVNEKYNITEADIVLELGIMVERYLKNAGCETMLLQSHNLNGEEPAYPNVCYTANRWPADIFISLHCNSFADTSANGTEVLVHNKWSRAGDLAECIQKRIIETLHTRDRKVKQNSDLCVLENTVMPAVLVETAFISNDSDVQLLMNNLDDFARAIACGITDFWQRG
nr:MAG TPA: Cell wall hydrolase autolysin [Caudoviricetes sp.]